MSAQSNAPIIIKKKKIIAGGGHHGGAWKVAIFHFLKQTALLRRCDYARRKDAVRARVPSDGYGIAVSFKPVPPDNGCRADPVAEFLRVC